MGQNELTEEDLKKVKEFNRKQLNDFREDISFLIAESELSSDSNT